MISELLVFTIVAFWGSFGQSRGGAYVREGMVAMKENLDKSLDLKT